jgi:hypothetical protein
MARQYIEDVKYEWVIISVGLALIALGSILLILITTLNTCDKPTPTWVIMLFTLLCSGLFVCGLACFIVYKKTIRKYVKTEGKK